MTKFSVPKYFYLTSENLEIGNNRYVEELYEGASIRGATYAHRAYSCYARCDDSVAMPNNANTMPKIHSRTRLYRPFNSSIRGMLTSPNLVNRFAKILKESVLSKLISTDQIL